MFFIHYWPVAQYPFEKYNDDVFGRITEQVNMDCHAGMTTLLVFIF